MQIINADKSLSRALEVLSGHVQVSAQQVAITLRQL